jgi:hypothetical protein
MYYKKLSKAEKKLAYKWMEKIRKLADEDKEICYWLMFFYDSMKELEEAKSKIRTKI